MTGIEGRWYYDGLMVSSVDYNSDTMIWLTPFSNGFKLAVADKATNQKYLIKDLSYLNVESEHSMAYYSNGQAILCFISFSETKKDRQYANGKYVSTFKAGTINIREENSGKRIVQGDVYMKDNVLYVLAGFTKDSSGKAIFHMFTR